MRRWFASWRSVALGCGLLGLAASCFRAGSSGNELLEPFDPANHDSRAQIAFTVLNGMLTIYNEHLAGGPLGGVGVTVPCPLTGTAKIAGSVAYDNFHGLTRVDLTFEFSQCMMSEAMPQAQITIAAGSIHQVGSFDSAGYTSESFMGTIDFSGQASGQPVGATGCALSMSRGALFDYYQSYYRSVSGQLCGTPFFFVPGGLRPDAGIDATVADGPLTDAPID